MCAPCSHRDPFGLFFLFPESACEGFFVKRHLNYVSSTSSHLHLCTSTFSPISLLIFTSAHLHLCSSSHPHIYTSHIFTSRSSLLSLKAEGSSAGAPRNATLCGDRACRGREMQARARFGPVRRNPLQRSCVLRARNAGESAFWPGPAQARNMLG